MCLYTTIFNEADGEGGFGGGGGGVGRPGSVIYRVSYVNNNRNFNKLYFKHVSVCPGSGRWVQRARTGSRRLGSENKVRLVFVKLLNPFHYQQQNFIIQSV